MRRVVTAIAVGSLLSFAVAGWMRAGVTWAAPSGPGSLDPPKAQAQRTSIESANDSRPEIKDLDVKIKALRDEFHSAIDPLQVQLKALRDKYEPQIKALEEQRKVLIEQTKSRRIQELDQQEDAELAALAEREKDEAGKLKARFAEERNVIQARYQALRKESRIGR